MATGLYWCLVLTECLSLVVVLTASLTQTTPPDSTPVCPGDRLVLTCIISGTNAFWQSDDSNADIRLHNGVTRSLGSFIVHTIINDTTAVAIATNEAVPLSLNGVTVGCVGSSGPAATYTIIIAG